MYLLQADIAIRAYGSLFTVWMFEMSGRNTSPSVVSMNRTDTSRSSVAAPSYGYAGVAARVAHHRIALLHGLIAVLLTIILIVAV